MSEKSSWQPLHLGLSTFFSVTLFLSWFFEPTRSLWLTLDTQTFWAMNGSLADNKPWQTFWAIANNRAFDLVAAGSMLALFAHRALLKDRDNLRQYLAIGLLMTVTLILALQIGKGIPIERPSATAQFPDALRLSQLVPEIDTKDISSDSFPGDHGLVLLLFAGFVIRYLPRGYGLLAVLFAIFFTTPRLMSGAHWLTDELVGALSLGILILAWLFATPLHAIALDKIRSWITRA